MLANYLLYRCFIFHTEECKNSIKLSVLVKYADLHSGMLKVLITFLIFGSSAAFGSSDCDPSDFSRFSGLIEKSEISRQDWRARLADHPKANELPKRVYLPHASLAEKEAELIRQVLMLHEIGVDLSPLSLKGMPKEVWEFLGVKVDVHRLHTRVEQLLKQGGFKDIFINSDPLARVGTPWQQFLRTILGKDSYIGEIRYFERLNGGVRVGPLTRGELVSLYKGSSAHRGSGSLSREESSAAFQLVRILKERNVSQNAPWIEEFRKSKMKIPKDIWDLDYARLSPAKKKKELLRQYKLLMKAGIGRDAITLGETPRMVWGFMRIHFEPHGLIARVRREFREEAIEAGLSPMEYIATLAKDPGKEAVFRYLPQLPQPVHFGPLTDQELVSIARAPKGIDRLTAEEQARLAALPPDAEGLPSTAFFEDFNIMLLNDIR